MLRNAESLDSIRMWAGQPRCFAGPRDHDIWRRTMPSKNIIAAFVMGGAQGGPRREKV